MELVDINSLLHHPKYRDSTISHELLDNFLQQSLTIAKAYATIQNITAIEIGGSLGRAYTDKESDIEMYVYYKDGLPTKEEILNVIRNDLHGVLTRSDNVHRYHKARGYHSFFKFKDTNIELGYRDINGLRSYIKQFNNNFILPQHGIHDTPFGHYPSGLLSSIDESVILYDKQGDLQDIKNNISYMPENIKRKTIEYYFNDIYFLFRDKLQTAAKRQDIYLFMTCLTRLIRACNIVLFSLHDRYYPGDKWNQKYLEHFHDMPANFINRSKELYAVFDNSSHSYTRVMEEVQALLTDIEDVIRAQYGENITLKAPDLESEREVQFSIEDIVTLLLGHKCSIDDMQYTQIKQTLDTGVYLVTFQGKDYILRNAGTYVSTVQPQQYITEILGKADNFPYSTPQIVHHDGKTIRKIGDFFYYIYPYIPGEHINMPTLSYAQELGKLVAQYHTAINTFLPDVETNKYVQFLRNKDIFNYAYIDTYIDSIHTIDAMRKTASTLGTMYAMIKQIPVPILPKDSTVCYADFNAGNILMAPQGEEITGLVDFGGLRKMPAIFDLQNGLQNLFLEGSPSKDNEYMDIIDSYYTGLQMGGWHYNHSGALITYYMIHDLFLTICRLIDQKYKQGRLDIQENEIVKKIELLRKLLYGDIHIPDITVGHNG